MDTCCRMVCRAILEFRITVPEPFKGNKLLTKSSIPQNYCEASICHNPEASPNSKRFLHLSAEVTTRKKRTFLKSKVTSLWQIVRLMTCVISIHDCFYVRFSFLLTQAASYSNWTLLSDASGLRKRKDTKGVEI